MPRLPSMDRRTLGMMSETLACEYLKQEIAFRLVERNFRCPLGEVDIIGWDGQELVFVEVRSRSSQAFGIPEESVGRTKQQRLRRLAAYYVAGRKLDRVNCRFDVITVMMDGMGNLKVRQYLPGAF